MLYYSMISYIYILMSHPNNKVNKMLSRDLNPAHQWHTANNVASGADRHLDLPFGLQLGESSSFVSVLFREAFNHPYISFFSFTSKWFFC